MKGSYTIEASILVPILIGIYFTMIHGGMVLYTRIRDEEPCEKVKTVWEVDDFYLKGRLKEELSTEGN